MGMIANWRKKYLTASSAEAPKMVGEDAARCLDPMWNSGGKLMQSLPLVTGPKTEKRTNRTL